MPTISAIKRRACRAYARKAEASVYIAELVKENVIKIGFSASPPDRIRTLGWTLQRPVYLRWHIHPVERAHARQIEQAFHRKFKPTDVNIAGEWYRMTPREAVDAIESLAASLDIKITSPTTGVRHDGLDRIAEYEGLGTFKTHRAVMPATPLNLRGFGKKTPHRLLGHRVTQVL